MNRVEFTYGWYDRFIRRLTSEGYGFHGFDEEIDLGTVVLRHDVDWSPRKAVRLAEIESDQGACSTFFFLVSSPFYNALDREQRRRIREVLELGHEVGLHFSTHQYWEDEPDERKLVDRIESECCVLAEAADAPVDAVSFHNPPDWVLRREFDEFTSAYEPRFFEEIEYRADSNQRWRGEHPLAGGIPNRLQILSHPVLWGEHDGWTTDRLREERDYLLGRVSRHLKRTDRTWESLLGL